MFELEVVALPLVVRGRGCKVVDHVDLVDGLVQRVLVEQVLPRGSGSRTGPLSGGASPCGRPPSRSPPLWKKYSARWPPMNPVPPTMRFKLSVSSPLQTASAAT